MITISDWHARVGQRVFDFRAAHKLNLAEMSSRVGGIQADRLTAIEAGADDIRLDDLERISVAIGCEVPELLEADEDEWTRAVEEV
ncbi:helix-turn-helix domain-containing protein [Methylobacterium sp. ID0610]|uniref:helix-turn-helix domain-containing protein n=1 Tax=Methylobacterium carpenticola TaxID=3344827 RepID=UPI00368B9051